MKIIKGAGIRWNQADNVLETGVLQIDDLRLVAQIVQAGRELVYGRRNVGYR
jgi:hypothetical protein